ncbi:response regulator transcription factor [Brooklawnia cerclae]|uniref:Two-component system OmpR family response regulator n=1 Tax=Brooklawnia cerclae TaxID=349934 RepID=A0ABX0SCQ5_9ACTN|nr:response regulator transcription factor [Brooklawnia cerclae]NIH56179.1 two-component system OmpR family response regulator [Brooklawnia cerclae]
MRLLVVEDNPHLAASLKKGLQASGFAVDVALNGVDGAHLATNEAYDCIVLDIMLPSMNGYDVLKRVRASGCDAPVLMLTAKDGDLDQIDAFDLGADDYVTKPFGFVVLVARINALLRRGRTHRAPVLQVGDLLLDTSTNTARRGDVSIELTAKETSLLEYLMLHEGRIVSKTELLDHCWDSNYEGSDNVVEVYVHYLRRKLDEPFGVHTLFTRRGAGYQLTAGTEPEGER